MKVGLLGAGGCFALNFAKHLKSAGIEHFGIGRSPVKAPAFWQVHPDFRYQQAHLVSQLPQILRALDIERPDVIVNFAAQGEGAASFADNAPDFFQTNCVALSRLVCELRKRDWLQMFVQIGSSEVYGSVDHPALESDPCWPGSPYGLSKAAFDQYLMLMWKTWKFPAVVVRPSNCYVEGQQLHRIIPKTLIAAMAGRPLELHGGGKAEKSYLYAGDLSRALMQILKHRPLGEIFNVGPDEPVTIKHVVEACCTVVGADFDKIVKVVPDRTGQDSRYWLDSTKIKNLGWKEGCGLFNGLQLMYLWVKNHPELLTEDSTYRHRV